MKTPYPSIGFRLQIDESLVILSVYLTLVKDSAPRVEMDGGYQAAMGTYKLVEKPSRLRLQLENRISATIFDFPTPGTVAG